MENLLPARQRRAPYLCPMRRCLFLLLGICALGARGQDSAATRERWRWNPVDSYRNALQRIPGFRMSFDSRRSVLSGVPVNVSGLRYGLDYGKMAFWTGIYATNMFRTINEDTFNQGFSYTSSTFEYYVHQSWRFEVVTSFQAGIGWGYDYRKRGSTLQRYNQGVILPLEMGLGGTVRFLRYFGFYGGVGIRMSALRNTSFTGPYWSFGLTYYTGTMYRDAKKAWKKIRG